MTSDPAKPTKFTGGHLPGGPAGAADAGDPSDRPDAMLPSGPASLTTPSGLIRPEVPGGAELGGTANPADPVLQTADQVRAAAEQFTKAADAYHRRLKTEAAHLASGEVFARLQEEQRLRGIANQLYFEASERTLAVALDDQAALLATLQAAAERLAGFQRFEHATALVTGLLVLGGAIVAGKVSPLVYALQEVRADLKAG